VPTRNVNLTDELDSFVLAKVESGRYENASEVVRAALQSLERDEREYEAKLAGLRAIRLSAFARRSNSLASRASPWRPFAIPSAPNGMTMIANFTLKRWGEDQVVRYLDCLEACCQKLAVSPALGRTCDDVRPGLRRMEQ
jgi:putative addiction module CopG family antidote